MRVELIETTDGLEALAPEWRDLLQRAESTDLFVQPEWLIAWARAVAAPRQCRLACFAVRQPCGDLVALIPMQSSRKMGARMLGFAGFPRHADRMDAIFDPACEQDAMAAFANELAGRTDWDVLAMRHAGAFSGYPRRLSAALSATGLRTHLAHDACTWNIDLTRYASLEEYLSEYRSARSRKAMRRDARRLAENVGAHWRMCHEMDEATLDAIVDLDCRRTYRAQKGQAFFLDPANRAFIEELARLRPDPDFWHLTILANDAQVLCFELSFDIQGRRMSYQTAFDLSLASYGAGNLALIEALRHAWHDGCREFDFLAGDEAYKAKWCRDNRQTWRLGAYRNTPVGRSAHLYHRYVKPMRRKLAAGPLAAIVPEAIREKLDI